MRSARGRFGLAVAGLAILASIVTSPPRHAEAAGSTPPNIVIIVSDDQRADTLDPTFMPVVSDLLRDRSRTTVFENAFVPNASCCPSRVSILTGAHSHTTGVYGNGPPYGGFDAFDDDVSIATALTADYRTLFVGKYLNGYPERNYGYVPPGWDRWFAIRTGSFYNYDVADNGVRSAFYGDRPRHYSGRVLTKEAIRYVNAAEATGEPFFLYYAPTAPHRARDGSSIDGPTVDFPSPDPRDVDRFASIGHHRPPTYGNHDDVTDMPAFVQDLPWNRQRREHTDLFRQRQLESIYSLDRQIGELVAQVPDDTLVLFLSDNGYMWGEHRWATKLVPYEESIGVPMWVRWPIGTDIAGVDADRLALNIDIVPTILDIAGYPADTPTASGAYTLGGVPQPPEGTSLLSGLARNRFVLEHWGVATTVPGYCGLRRADGYAYIRYWDRDSADDGFVEMYDVDADPLEQTNLALDPSYDDLELALRQATTSVCTPVPPYYSWKG